MKTKNIIIGLILTLIFPLGALALSAPTVEPTPDQINADFYTLIINAPVGSTVSVLGGPSFLAPVTDGAGSDELDGVVEVMVGLGQGQKNVFSITASRDGEFSESVEVIINETDTTKDSTPGDHIPPEPPVIDPIEGPITASEYTITGSVEADANIYVHKPDGTVAATTQANSNGIFFVTVDLEPGKTNRFNISAEDAAGNVGQSSQAVIQAIGIASEEEEEMGEAYEAEESSLPFSDIKGHWAESYISQIYAEGIVSGKTETSFEPNANITRAELTKIAVNAFNIAPPEQTSQVFSDVPESAWFYQYVTSAKGAGIVDGYSDNTFKPNEPITRAAALKILLEASDAELGTGLTDFSDVPNNAWFAPYVAFAKTNGIVGGYADGTFGPGKFITRAEVAKIVMKLLE